VYTNNDRIYIDDSVIHYAYNIMKGVVMIIGVGLHMFVSTKRAFIIVCLCMLLLLILLCNKSKKDEYIKSIKDDPIAHIVSCIIG